MATEGAKKASAIAEEKATPLILRPIEAFETALMRNKPIARCCCCSSYCGIIWTAVGVMLESFWQFGTSIARPTWEWNESVEQIFSFALANFVRSAARQKRIPHGKLIASHGLAASVTCAPPVR
jgi:hypothetical protein